MTFTKTVRKLKADIPVAPFAESSPATPFVRKQAKALV